MFRFLKKNADTEEPDGAIAVGCGGAGCNAVNRLGKFSDVDIMTVNTDRKGLVRSRSNLRILLGNGSNEEGCGGDVGLGTRLARESLDQIEEGIRGYHYVFVITGLGGGTGTGSAKVVSERAKRNGSRVISMVSVPMAFESERREAAVNALPELAEHSDIMLVLDGDRLVKIDPMIGVREAFSVLDQMICESFIAMAEMFGGEESLFQAMNGIVTVSFAEGMNSERVADGLVQGMMADAPIRSPPIVFVRGNILDGTISAMITESTGMRPIFIQGPGGQGMNMIMFSPIKDPYSSL